MASLRINALLFLLLGICSAHGSESLDTNCNAALDAATLQLDGLRKTYTDPTQIPRSWQDGEVRLVDAGDWISGFTAGSFWLLYEHSGDPGWRETAEAWTAALEEQKNNTTTHDVGFMMYNSFGNGLRLTGNSSYEPILVQTAESLMTRFNETVGAIRSWSFGDWKFPVIVDNMMNLELLYSASEMTGGKAFAAAATAHALTTLQSHYRADFSSYHVVDFDPETGAVIARQTHQGIADESAWSRGQAWGLYGFTMTYRFTRDERFLELAENIAMYYLDHPSLPEDKVPYFDFDAPDYPDISNNRDSAAAAITASALLELASFADEPQASRYRNDALAMLKSLASPVYAAKQGENGQFLLMHATGNQPANSEVDAAINYADYYYLEALLRCKRLTGKTND